MEIVIDISEDDYKTIINTVLSIGKMFETTKGRVVCAIASGTPLPKGHGRLGDLSELEERISSFISYDENIIDEKLVLREKFILDGIKDTPTIIEADREMKMQIESNRNLILGHYPEKYPKDCTCGCEVRRPYKRNCYFYYNLRVDIPCCKLHIGLGNCPCENCAKFISRSDAFDVILNYVNKEGENGD